MYMYIIHTGLPSATLESPPHMESPPAVDEGGGAQTPPPTAQSQNPRGIYVVVRPDDMDNVLWKGGDCMNLRVYTYIFQLRGYALLACTYGL